jgi:membrane associated rhomboid family serine protease
MVVLLFLGKNVEERIGSLKFLVFYPASGIAGNIVYASFISVLTNPYWVRAVLSRVFWPHLFCAIRMGLWWLPGFPIFLRVWMLAPFWFISELLNAINEQYAAPHRVERGGREGETAFRLDGEKVFSH